MVSVMAKKTIVCFGDSNTWGFIPATEAERYPNDVRWPGVLATELGDTGYRVLEEAQNGRTTVHDDPFETINKNGSRHLPVVLESQKPIDLVIVMLGTNDLKTHFGQSADNIAHGAAELCERIRSSDAGLHGSAPKVLLVSPPAVAPGDCPFGNLFDGAAETSSGFAQAYQMQAASRGLDFLDAAEHATCPTTDCIHLDSEGQRALGLALSKKVQEVLRPSS